MRSRARTCLVLALALALPAAAAAQDKGPCGSAEKFEQTKRWEDLPGCAGYESYDDENRTAMILARAKRKFRDFFERWIIDDDFGGESTGVTWEYRQGVRNYVEDADAARWRTDPQLVAARPAFDEMRGIVERHLGLKDSFPLIKKLGASFSDAKFRTDALSAAGGKDSDFAAVYLKELRDDLQRVVAAGVPDSTVITSHKKRTYTLAEVKADVASIAGAQKESGDKFKAEEEAKWRPFTSVLKGDRLDLFNRYRVGILQGVGGRVLDTPQEFQTTPMMAKYTIDESGAVNRWNMTIWRLRGDRIVATQTRSGWGNEPPSAAFR